MSEGSSFEAAGVLCWCVGQTVLLCCGVLCCFVYALDDPRSTHTSSHHHHQRTIRGNATQVGRTQTDKHGKHCRDGGLFEGMRERGVSW